MGASQRELRDLPKTELETVVQWPIVAVAAGLPILFLVMLIGVVLGLDGNRQTPKKTEAVAQQTSAVVQEIDKRRAAPRQSTQSKQITDTPSPRVVESITPSSAAQVSEPELLPPPKPEPARQVAAFPSSSRDARMDASQAQAAVAPRPALRERPPRLSEFYLALFLRDAVPEVDLESVKGSSEKLLATAKEGRSKTQSGAAATAKTEVSAAVPGSQQLEDLLKQRTDLSGLPVRKGTDCQAGKAAAGAMQAMSRELRRTRIRKGEDDHYRDTKLIEFMSQLRDKELREDNVPALDQAMQAEKIPVRLQLIRTLASIDGPLATAAIARRAMFDLAEEVREAAVKELKSRPRDEYRQILLDGLRYPWSPVAEHAADALVAREVRDAVPSLLDLLDKPDPCAPVQNQEKKWVVPELVRVNHLRNCLLCHAPSFNQQDPVRGLVPTPGKPLPVEYYDRGSGDFVRADVTYLKQDFSELQPVANPDKWPQFQRFDYLIRMRELDFNELKLRTTQELSSYPQREAVLYALRGLTGKDAGDCAKDWRQALRDTGLAKSP